MTILTKANFDSEVTQSSIPVVADFYADWCGPCKQLGPVLHEIDTEMAGKVKICKVNVDVEQQLAQQFGVMSIPTIIFFKDGKEVTKQVGSSSKADLVQKITTLIG